MRDQTISLAVTLGSASRLAGGMYNSVRELSLHLNAFEVVPKIYALRDAWSEADRSRWGDVKVSCHSPKPWAKFGYSLGLRGDLLRTDHHILHQHGIWQGFSLISREWGRGKRRPVVISPRGMLDEWALKNSALKKQVAASLYEKSNIAQASCLHALCDAELSSIRAFGYKGPVAVIPNGASPVCCKDSPSFLKGKGVLQESRKIMLYLGRLHPKKGLEEFFKAISDVPEDGWRIAIAGWGEEAYIKHLKKVSFDYGLSSKVQFIGELHGEEKDAAFRAASAFFLPSHSEGLPMAVLEAWSYGLASLITSACNFNAPPQAAISVGTTVPELRSGYLQLTSLSDMEREAMGTYARDLMTRHYSWPVIAAQTRQTYDWVLNGGSVPSWIDPG